MRKYIVEFTFIDGTKEEVEFTTDRLQWTIDQWVRHRKVIKHQVLEEGTSNSKSMIFG